MKTNNTRSPDDNLTLPSGGCFLWSEARVVKERKFSCECCESVTEGFKIKGLIGRSKTIFCVDCFAVLFKSGYFGPTYVSNNMPVHVRYHDGELEELRTHYM